jgi:hypothetical protein
MDLAEPRLVFGATFSAGIYDALAKTTLNVVVRLAQFPSETECQYLDEVGAACPEGTGSRARLEQAYRKVTVEVGERLASTDD